jgi:hypothetical protein
MIDRAHALPVTRQARELGISRGSVYYLPRPTSAADLAIMRRIDELHMDFPFAGSRMLRDLLAAEGIKVGRLHVSTLMKKMGVAAIYRRPNTSKPEPGHKIYPYLLRKLAVTRPNLVWATDITYIVSIRRRPSGVTSSRARERSGRLLDLDGLPCRYPVPGEQFLNAGLRMIRHSGDDVGEPGVGIDVVEATGLDEGIHAGLFSSLDLKLMRGFVGPGSVVRGEGDFG